MDFGFIWGLFQEDIQCLYQPYSEELVSKISFQMLPSIVVLVVILSPLFVKGANLLLDISNSLWILFRGIWRTEFDLSTLGHKKDCRVHKEWT